MRKIIYVDIDGTISYNPELPDFGDRHADYEKAKPLTDRIEHINLLFDEGHEIHYWTARGVHSGTDFTDLTKQQFLDWGVKYHELHVNVGKPHFDMYICDKSYNAASFFHRTERNLP